MRNEKKNRMKIPAKTPQAEDRGIIGHPTVVIVRGQILSEPGGFKMSKIKLCAFWFQAHQKRGKQGKDRTKRGLGGKRKYYLRAQGKKSMTKRSIVFAPFLFLKVLFDFILNLKSNLKSSPLCLSIAVKE